MEIIEIKTDSKSDSKLIQNINKIYSSISMKLK